jgi:hypothetical protein
MDWLSVRRRNEQIIQALDDYEFGGLKDLRPRNGR